MAIVICSITRCCNRVWENSDYLCKEHEIEYQKDLADAKAWMLNNYGTIAELLVKFHEYKTNKEIPNENMDQDQDIS